MPLKVVLEPFLGSQRGGADIIARHSWDVPWIFQGERRNARDSRVEFNHINDSWQGFVSGPLGGLLFWPPSGGLDSWFHARLAGSCSLALALGRFLVDP